MFTLAHLSDLHLGPLPKAQKRRDYLSKRAIGYWSWNLKRFGLHLPAIADQMAADIRSHQPDHVAVTGDLVNIALPGEFQNAARWLERFGSPGWITVVPGNHDAYVPVPWEIGAGLWAPYMTGDLRMPGAPTGTHLATPFPFVRQRKNIAIVGVSSAEPQGYRHATGQLGSRQMDDLAATLGTLRERGFFRILLIHHPPLPGQSPVRKALIDATNLKSVIEAQGAELVLFGHNHIHMRATIETRFGRTHTIGVPSATTRPGHLYPAAAWYKYAIRRHGGVWHTKVTVHALSSVNGNFEPQTEFDLVN
jgi:3',5'-cyclic AMP phosphodiesterase CpdA